MSSQVTISGKVFGADSKLINDGIVAIQSNIIWRYKSSIPIKNGKFELVYDLNEPEFTLIIGAPYHIPEKLDFPTYLQNTIEIEVKLQSLNEPKDGFKIVTELDDFNNYHAITMNKIPDGTYTIVIPTSNETLLYKIIYEANDFKNFNYVLYDNDGYSLPLETNGTSGKLVETFYGTFYSEIQVENGNAVINFDPTVIPKQNEVMHYFKVLNEPLKTKLIFEPLYKEITEYFHGELTASVYNLDSSFEFSLDTRALTELFSFFRNENKDNEVQLLLDMYYIDAKFF